jgi:RNA polymerase sigma-70 factor (ECF subfamily)
MPETARPCYGFLGARVPVSKQRDDDSGRSRPAGSAPARLLCLGRAAHPTLPLNDQAFFEHLAGCHPLDADEPGDERAGDLYLACAALSGHAAAVATLQRLLWPVIVNALRAFEISADTLDETGQELWDALLVGRADAPPKLRLYAGRGALAAFVAITAQRLVLLRLRKQEVHHRAAQLAALELQAVTSDFELGFLKAQYRDRFQDAVRAALDGLDDRSRLIFRLYLIDGLSIDRIAKAYQVSQSTVSRWLAKARATIFDDTRRLLREGLAMPDEELDSLWNLVASQVDLSLSALLRDRC